VSIEAAKEIAEELKSEKTFDARKAITGATYPTDFIDVYSDAALAHELNVTANEAAKARYLADSIKAGWIKQKQAEDAKSKSIEDEPYAGDGTEAPGYQAAADEAAILEGEVAEAVERLRESVLTFHVRGLAPAQWRLIDSKQRKAIKPPARKNFPNTEEGEEAYEVAVHERNLLRTHAINNDLIASAIVKVVRKHDGAEDTHTWTQEEVADINDFYLESEYNKIKDLVNQLTFANNLFSIAVEKDADFLPKH
jgi:hypothetical protein